MRRKLGKKLCDDGRDGKGDVGQWRDGVGRQTGTGRDGDDDDTIEFLISVFPQAAYFVVVFRLLSVAFRVVGCIGGREIDLNSSRDGRRRHGVARWGNGKLGRDKDIGATA